LLGYPQAALADINHALKNAREIGHAATLMFALAVTTLIDIPSAETMRQQVRKQAKSSPWRTKRAPCTGRRSECCGRLGF
jgi:hypothetical protein